MHSILHSELVGDFDEASKNEAKEAAGGGSSKAGGVPVVDAKVPQSQDVETVD